MITTKNEFSESVYALETLIINNDAMFLKQVFRQPAKETKKPRLLDRKVRFGPAVVVAEIEARSDDQNERNTQYLSPDDMKIVRNNAKLTAKFFRFKDKASVKFLDQGYRAANQLMFVSNEEYTSYMGNPELIDQIAKTSLTEWCAQKWSGRGLERYCSSKQRIDRPHMAVECREAVLRLSAQKTVTEQQLAQFYHEYSRPATVFSRLLGHADQLAAYGPSMPTVRPLLTLADIFPEVGGGASRTMFHYDDDKESLQLNIKATRDEIQWQPPGPSTERQGKYSALSWKGARDKKE